jgi:hypothetical protein
LSPAFYDLPGFSLMDPLWVALSMQPLWVAGTAGAVHLVGAWAFATPSSGWSTIAGTVAGWLVGAAVAAGSYVLAHAVGGGWVISFSIVGAGAVAYLIGPTVGAVAGFEFGMRRARRKRLEANSRVAATPYRDVRILPGPPTILPRDGGWALFQPFVSVRF